MFRILLPQGGAPLIYSDAMGAIRRAHLIVPLRDPFRYGPSRADQLAADLEAGKPVSWVDGFNTIEIRPQ